MFREVLTAVAMATGGFLFVMVVGNLVKEFLPLVVSGRLPWSDFFGVMFMLVPSVAPYVMPVGMLTGVLLVLGRMSAQNEITAMKASGLNLARIASPIVAIGLAAAILAAFVNFEYSPKANIMVKARLVGNVRSENFTDYIPVKTAYAITEDVTIYASAKEGPVLRDVWIWRTDKNGNELELNRADTASLVFDRKDPDNPADDEVRLALANGVREQRIPGNPDTIGFRGSRTIDLGRIKSTSLFRASGGGFEKKLKWYDFPELMAAREHGFKTNAKSTAEERFADRINVQFQIQSSLANAFGILSLTLLAIPLGIRVARSETFVNMGVALALALVYYFANVSFQWVRNPHLRPDILVWIPNLVIQALAFRLFLKASRT